MRLISSLLFPYRRLILAFGAVSQLRRLTAARGISLRYLFENYAFDTDRRELQRGTDTIAIAPKVFDLLNYLIGNRERVVSKDDLITAIWEGRVISDVALTTRLNAARKAIGDSGDKQRLIKTFRARASVSSAPSTKCQGRQMPPPRVVRRGPPLPSLINLRLSFCRSPILPQTPSRNISSTA
jgi:hypothetical protein